MISLAYSGSYRPSTDAPRPEKRKPVHEEKKVDHSSRKPPEQPPFSLQGLLKRIEAVGLETDDLLLALVLYLMYRESGDKDLLILLGAMLLS